MRSKSVPKRGENAGRPMSPYRPFVFVAQTTPLLPVVPVYSTRFPSSCMARCHDPEGLEAWLENAGHPLPITKIVAFGLKPSSLRHEFPVDHIAVLPWRTT